MCSRRVLTQHGEVRYSRLVFECPACRRSHAPLDAELNVLPHDRMTMGVARKVAYGAAHASFPEASKHLLHQCGLEVSAAQCHRVAQHWGERLDALQRQRERSWTAPQGDDSCPAPAERAPERVVLEADATSVLTRKGEEHKMVYCATAFGLEDRVEKEGSGRRMLNDRRYAAGGLDFEDFESRFAALAARLDAHRAEAVAFIGDGAPCLWRLAEERLPPGTLFIQDYWHVCEHLSQAARCVWREDKAAEANASRWRLMLAESRIDDILAELRGLRRSLRGKRRNELGREIAYLESGRLRMDYARYRADGWIVGSGAVEGSCKHLIKGRYNVTGARWSREKIPLVLALRLSIFNGEWDEDWKTMRQAA